MRKINQNDLEKFYAALTMGGELAMRELNLGEDEFYCLAMRAMELCLSGNITRAHIDQARAEMLTQETK